ncbi:MAG: alkaline phosphatase family protein [Acidobacteria bacterium]|nr:alkaline phosphatase family protein [Acidobacteriota bacterium]
MLESCRVGTHGLGHNVREMCIAVDNASQPHLDALRRYPSVHGVRGDTGDGLADVPGLLHVLATEHKRSAMFYGWAPLRWLDPTDTVEHNGFEDVLDDPEADLLIARSAGRYIRAEQPDFAPVYFGGVDHAGHDHGWMSPRYLDQMRHLDSALAELIGSLPPGSTCCVSRIMAVTVTTTRGEPRSTSSSHSSCGERGFSAVAASTQP